MRSYLVPIQAAFLLFPVLAALFSLPYVVAQYRRYGALLLFRVLVVYSLILYLMCAFFLTALPLPPISQVAKMTTPIRQLHPFHFVQVFLQESCLVPGDPSTWLPALRQGCFYQPAFNLLLLFPLGVYLRYYFKRGWASTLLLVFSVTLCFELIQYSALFGIYPRPYRMFDVDDLFLNTLGGMLGFWLTPALSWLLPTRQQLDTLSYRKGRRVSYPRRLVAFCLDWGLLAGLVTLAHRGLGWPGLRDLLGLRSWGAALLYLGLVLLYFVALPWLTGGRTLGKALVGLKLAGEGGERPRFWQILVRQGMLYLVFLPAPVVALRLFERRAALSQGLNLPVLVLFSLLGLVSAFFVFSLFAAGLTRQHRLPYDKLAGTENRSTVARRGGEEASRP